MRRHWLPSPRYPAARSQSVSPAWTRCTLPEDAWGATAAADVAASAGDGAAPTLRPPQLVAAGPEVGRPRRRWTHRRSGRAGTSTIASTAATSPPASDCCTPSPRTRTAGTPRTCAGISSSTATAKVAHPAQAASVSTARKSVPSSRPVRADNSSPGPGTPCGKDVGASATSAMGIPTQRASSTTSASRARRAAPGERPGRAAARRPGIRAPPRRHP